MNTAMNTYSAKPTEVRRDWWHVNADGLILGRLAAMIAYRLQGKHKPTYTQHIDTGDCIVVTNIEKIAVTGNKLKDKDYYTHSGYPGGIKHRSLAEMNPEKVLRLAVKRMLPKGPLGREMIGKLKIYTGAEHPHAAQQPVDWTDIQSK
jgi:large subunit ribosomal protein L13